MLYQAYAHVISDTPLTAILSDAKKVSFNVNKKLFLLFICAIIAVQSFLYESHIVYSNISLIFAVYSYAFGWVVNIKCERHK